MRSQLRHRDIVASLCEDALCSFRAGLQLAEQMARAGTQVRVLSLRWSPSRGTTRGPEGPALRRVFLCFICVCWSFSL